ncbi:MAG: prepilin-type N-terminal cleavage/methylation domain-containing protein [Candidatus Shapirobacteria bacterium]|jgi:prepilin-type N-terminal cleavage/methylation domain-containing protein
MSQKSGFTLLEVTIVLGILALLFSITSLNLSNTAPKSSLDNAVQLLIANIKEQQLYALTGKTEDQTGTNFGIYFGPQKYTLFQGNTYDANDLSNYDVHLDDIDTSSTATGSVIIFTRNTGEIQNFQPTGNTITLTQTNIQQSKTITLNKYGIIESIF